MSDTSGTTYKVHSTSTLKPSRSDGQPNIKHLSVKSVKMLFLLFWVDASGSPNKKLFASPLYQYAPITREHNIINSRGYNQNKHIVEIIAIQDISDIVDKVPEYIKKHGGPDNVKVKEVSVHSHAGQDGPIGCLNPPKHGRFASPGSGISEATEIKYYFGQMKLNGGWDSVNFNWTADHPRFVIYGCDSALEVTSESNHSQDINKVKNFVLNISKLGNFKNVEVWGQPSKSYPSIYPDMRSTTIARNNADTERSNTWASAWGIKESGYYTYQVASSIGIGMESTLIGTGIHPMNCYINGKFIRDDYQSFFNDHRKKIDINCHVVPYESKQEQIDTLLHRETD